MNSGFWTKAFWADTFERVFFTVIQVVLGLLTVAGFNLATLDVSAWVVAILVAALGVIVKAGVASQIGGTVSPASLAPSETGV